MKAITVVITDLDDTLWDWVDIWYKSFKAMLDQLVKDSGVPEETLINDFKEVFTKHNTTEYAFAIEELRSLKSKHPNENLTEIYSDAIEAYRKARNIALKTYPGVLGTLITLKKKGVLLVGYTESMSFYTRYRLRKLELDYLFDYLYSPRDHELPENIDVTKVRYYSTEHYKLNDVVHRFTPAGKLKPSPEVLKEILKDIGVEPNKAVYIGDKLNKDISMAQSAGVVDIWAKYGEAKDRKEYELLRKVTHWTEEEVQKEKDTNIEEIKPSYTLENNFSELLEYFNFSPFMDYSSDKLDYVFKAWEKAVDVQMHFNEIELKIRNFAVTLLVAIIGAAGYSLKEGLTVEISGGAYSLSGILLIAGAIGIGLLWFVDGAWYHKLLYGAVKHALEIEGRYYNQIPEIGLSRKIKKESPIRLCKKRKIGSKGKLNIFYIVIIVILLVAGIYILPSNKEAPLDCMKKKTRNYNVKCNFSNPDSESKQVRQ